MGQLRVLRAAPSMDPVRTSKRFTHPLLITLLAVVAVTFVAVLVRSIPAGAQDPATTQLPGLDGAGMPGSPGGDGGPSDPPSGPGPSLQAPEGLEQLPVPGLPPRPHGSQSPDAPRTAPSRPAPRGPGAGPPPPPPVIGSGPHPEGAPVGRAHTESDGRGIVHRMLSPPTSVARAIAQSSPNVLIAALAALLVLPLLPALLLRLIGTRSGRPGDRSGRST